MLYIKISYGYSYSSLIFRIKLEYYKNESTQMIQTLASIPILFSTCLNTNACSASKAVSIQCFTLRKLQLRSEYYSTTLWILGKQIRIGNDHCTEFAFSCNIMPTLSTKKFGLGITVLLTIMIKLFLFLSFSCYFHKPIASARTATN